MQLEEAPEAALERPRDEANGDWASTVALRVSKLAHKNPREIAQIIVDHIPENDMIASVEIAGPGFMNFRLGGKWFADTVSGIETAGKKDPEKMAAFVAAVRKNDQSGKE